MLLDFITKAIHFDKQVIRNTPILEVSIDEFDDLADNSFDREFAHRFIRETRQFSAEKIQAHAIDYVFNQPQLRPSRFSNGSFPAWYASLDQLTTFYETGYHWYNYVLRDIIHLENVKPIIQERSLFHVNCNAILLDLRENVKDMPELISQHEAAYQSTRLLGKKLYEQGNPGLYTASARNQKGENIVIYNKKILSAPKHFKDVIYEYNPNLSKIMIKDYQTDKLLAEI